MPQAHRLHKGCFRAPLGSQKVSEHQVISRKKKQMCVVYGGIGIGTPSGLSLKLFTVKCEMRVK